ncbi:Por secretion system C-terminal sorting domain-containing protein, partial [Hymenobacter daecheongensis DSM 21074]
GFGSVSVTLTAVPAGSYQVYTYVWEDNNPEVFSVTLNGQTVRANYNSGPAGTWARLGPFAATLTAPGALVVGATGGAANFSGIEVWRLTTTPAPAPALTTTAAARAPAPATALYPNPSPTGRYTLEVPAALGPQVAYSLVSAVGQVLSQGQLRLEPGSPRTLLDLAGLSLPPGIYQLRLTGNQQLARVKLMR